MQLRLETTASVNTSTIMYMMTACLVKASLCYACHQSLLVYQLELQSGQRS